MVRVLALFADGTKKLDVMEECPDGQRYTSTLFFCFLKMISFIALVQRFKKS